MRGAVNAGNGGGRRRAAAVRGVLPVLSYLGFFLAGQVFSAVFESGPLCLALCGAAILAIMKGFRPVARGLVPVALGACLLYVSIAQIPDGAPPEASLRIRIEGRVRRATPGEVSFDARLIDAPREVRGLKGHFRGVDVPWRNLAGVEEDQNLLAVRATCEVLRHSCNPFSYESTLRRRGVSLDCRVRYASAPSSGPLTMVARLRRSIERLVYEARGAGEDEGLFLSMFAGLPDTLSERTEHAFKQTGLMHVLIVSGYQVTLLYQFMRVFVMWCLTRFSSLALHVPVRFFAEGGGLAIALIYVALTGCEGAVLRAGIAVVLCALARMLERRSAMLHVVLATLLVTCVISPGAFLEPGTQLTFAALFGLCAGTREEDSAMMQYLRACVSATLFTSFVSLCWFGTLSPVALVLNPLLAAPVSALVCQGGVYALAAYATGLDRFGLSLRLVTGVLHCFKEIVLAASELSWASFECSLPVRVTLATVFAFWIVTRLRGYLRVELPRMFFRSRGLTR